jgi:hypothetical protein
MEQDPRVRRLMITQPQYVKYIVYLSRDKMTQFGLEDVSSTRLIRPDHISKGHVPHAIFGA